MKRFVVTFICSFILIVAFSQEETALDSISTIKGESDVNRLNLIMPSTFDASSFTEGIKLFESFRFDQPLVPAFSKNFDFTQPLHILSTYPESVLNADFGFIPFLSTGKIFNQATYRLNDRFLLGGNSFGAQSVFDPPRLNSSIQNMNVKGASLFLQYKVSKSVKVEGRVSISNRTNPWEP
jgi:hypothetical protein